MQRANLLALCSTALLVLAPGVPASPQTAPRKLVELVIRGTAGEEPVAALPLGPVQRNFRGQLSLLRRIADDPEVAGVLLDVRAAPDYARATDLLAELRHVQASGKSVFCYAETLGQAELRLASVADLLAMPPAGLLALEGLTAEAMYLKPLLEKLHARVEVLHIGGFKTAYEELARDDMSPAQRQTIGDLLDEYYDELLASIGENRDLDRTAVEAFFEQVLVEPQAALAGGLLDAVCYEDEFRALVRERFDESLQLVTDYGDEGREDLQRMLSNPLTMFSALARILEPPRRRLPEVPRLAIVYASGPITSGKSVVGFDGRVASMGSETIVEALEAARRDKLVRAVVLRVNSPGGSALASDQIWRAIERVRAEKPVVASMGQVAGSGGYWISMGCDRIVAQPTTITGSIGVVSALPDLSGSLAALGIKIEVVSRGPHAGELSLLADGPSELLKQKLTGMMEGVYATFLDKVAAGRGLAQGRVAELAQGRVWTGRQALANGLVDQLGGLREAVLLACELGGLEAGGVPILELPEPGSLFDQFEEMFGLVTTRTGRAELLARELGFEEAVRLAESMLGEPAPLGPDRVQCVVPFTLRIR